MDNVAFNPLPNPSPRVLALTSARGQRGMKLSGADHRDLLSDRLQRLISLCPSPRAAVDRLSQDLEEMDLWRQGRPSPAEAAQVLVADNALLVGRLDLLGALPVRYSGLTVEPNSSAAALLLQELQDPPQALQQWSSLLRT